LHNIDKFSYVLISTGHYNKLTLLG